MFQKSSTSQRLRKRRKKPFKRPVLRRQSKSKELVVESESAESKDGTPKNRKSFHRKSRSLMLNEEITVSCPGPPLVSDSSLQEEEKEYPTQILQLHTSVSQFAKQFEPIGEKQMTEPPRYIFEGLTERLEIRKADIEKVQKIELNESPCETTPVKKHHRRLSSFFRCCSPENVD
eukprot:TRINITY_DN12534_c0_g1_i2.p2 TRINITY_DN12534_c0_g1~~TRINITY_DN12534_c0_g1_i2.p2  ORF type:complete len:175 (+),score=15.04 TRINITY_DN12534_c0_g1_i2:81-605(+)